MNRTVVAVGGNALREDPEAPFARQRERIADTASDVAAVARERGLDLAVTHGNGPQVGNRLIEEDAADTPTVPLDGLVAETQGSLGSYLARDLRAALDGPSAALVTHAVVDADDPAFDEPSKPVGPYYTPEEAAEREFPTREVAGAEGEATHRRVVASPEPERILEREAIVGALDDGVAVVCGGGGGVPVEDVEDGYRGVDAVVDKDHTSRLVATAADAERLVFLTDVEFVYVDFEGPDQEPLRDVDAAAVRAHLRNGEFEAGSMQPKVEAALGFLDDGGEEVVVCHATALADALDGETGTRIS